MSDQQIVVHLTQEKDYRFQIAFEDGAPDLTADEPPPLGSASGPSPVQLLAAAVGSCLSDSLLFALRKFKQNPEPVRCEVQADVGRNPEGRMRVLRMKVVLTLGVEAGQLAHLDRVLDQFEEFCTVTQSVRAGIQVTVEVYDAATVRLK
ncbi:MAG TPA: OsmC family protein [Polaromonas sp.]|uniref:OsmC family protein n=1 Tax=Polaromonas sp. TaxID=1869339 RepID=UPI002D52342E|nr:OsmC family protein [Polaromonas sp.]HYW58317.1 OsmC family protein [Polaromonas sp.]